MKKNYELNIVLKGNLKESDMKEKKILVDNYNIRRIIYARYKECVANKSYVMYVGDLNTSRVTSMLFLFRQMEKLIKIEGLENWDVSNVVDMMSMFNGCINLESLDISNWDVSNVINMEAMFRGCKKLTKLDLSKWKLEKIEGMAIRSMFENCENLKSIDISGFYTLRLTIIYSLFKGCISLKKIDGIENILCCDAYLKMSLKEKEEIFEGTRINIKQLRLKVNNVTLKILINARYKDCIDNKSYIMYVGDLDTSQVTNMEYLFYEFYSLKKIDGIEYWDTSNVTNMNHMISKCFDLKEINLSSFDTNRVIDMSYMISYNHDLRRIILSNTFILNGTKINNMFYRCYKLKEILNINLIINTNSFKNLSKEEKRNVFHLTLINYKKYILINYLKEMCDRKK